MIFLVTWFHPNWAVASLFTESVETVSCEAGFGKCCLRDELVLGWSLTEDSFCSRHRTSLWEHRVDKKHMVLASWTSVIALSINSPELFCSSALESVKWEQYEFLLHFISPGSWKDNMRFWLGQRLIKLNRVRVTVKNYVGARSTDPAIGQARLGNQLCHWEAVWPCASYLTTLGLYLLFYKTRRVLLPPYRVVMSI